MATTIVPRHGIKTSITFSVNGRAVYAPRVSPLERLSKVLRERLGLTGTKVGCDAGDCGACTVLLDGEPVCSCLVAAGQIEGCEVTTVEGLAAGAPIRRPAAEIVSSSRSSAVRRLHAGHAGFGDRFARTQSAPSETK